MPQGPRLVCPPRQQSPNRGVNRSISPVVAQSVQWRQEEFCPLTPLAAFPNLLDLHPEGDTLENVSNPLVPVKWPKLFILVKTTVFAAQLTLGTLRTGERSELITLPTRVLILLRLCRIQVIPPRAR